MTFTKNNFPEVTSRHSHFFTLFIKGFGWLMSVFVPIAMIGSTVIVFNSRHISIGLKIGMLVLSLLLVWFFGWLMITMRKKTKSNATKITIDKNGINYYSDIKLIRTLNYNDLKIRPQNEKYDVFLSDLGEGSPFLLNFYVLDSESGKLLRKHPDFDSDVAITNSNQLTRHFVTGILYFRPDLKIEPGVLNLYKLEGVKLT
ncbi:hypothetical protein ABIE26_003212 [Pedobacter africanus]|uniref:Uncharacterized protein n=1 Tax=Pedobacter africanus TaxID=151894 RepID=A0ACC6KZJ6_9SPHI|nr:hypothetical protein [Pedobacter africanus]MDR6784567.1 hypothetical protein [Pedobacter africanus]